MIGGLGGLTARSMELRYERVVFFTDAVFAIVVTLLVIDLRPPAIADAASFDAALIAIFQNPAPFTAIAIGFAVVGSYWLSHRAIFALFERVDGLVVWANLFFLFWIALQPFFTAAVAQHVTAVSVAAYAGCQVLAGLAQLALWGAALRDRTLLIPSIRPRRIRYITLQLIRSPLAFALSIPVALLVSPAAGMVIWGSIGVFAGLIHLGFRDLDRPSGAPEMATGPGRA